MDTYRADIETSILPETQCRYPCIGVTGYGGDEGKHIVVFHELWCSTLDGGELKENPEAPTQGTPREPARPSHYWLSAIFSGSWLSDAVAAALLFVQYY